ncbi:MAG: carboxypeptidase regulatory-like domain-containing protein [Thermoplasmata archaeon]
MVLLLALGVPARASASPSTTPAAETERDEAAQLPVGHRFPTPIRHVIVIMDENQAYSTVLQYGPFEQQLTETYASADDYWSNHHNSPIDYVAATSGVDSVDYNETQTSIADLTGEAGLTWGEYDQSMPWPCDANISVVPDQLYTPGHSPFIRYQDVAGNYATCRTHILPLTDFYPTATVGTVPNYLWITPNNDNDSHNDNVSVGDAWLRTFVSGVENDSWFNSTALFITYDEGSTLTGHLNYEPFGVGGGQIYTAVVSPFAKKGYSSPIPYDTYDLLTTTEWLLGLGSTGHNDSWSEYPPMFDLFDFNSTYPISGTVTTPTGAPLAGAEIVNTVNNWTASSDSGAFSLSSPNDTWTLTASAPGYGPEMERVTVNGTGTKIHFVLEPEYSLHGVVDDRSGRPVARVLITADLPGAGNWSVISSTNGSFVAELPNGSWTLTAALAGYVSESETVTVQGPGPAIPPFSLSPVPPSYKYTVRLTNGTGPVDNAWITLVGSPPPMHIFFPTTPGALGGYSSAVVVNGTYRAIAVREGYEPASFDFTIRGANVTAQLKMVPAVMFRIGLRVFGQGGGPLSGADATYSVDNATLPLGAPTNVSGITSGEVPNGSYPILVRAVGYEPGGTIVQISGASVNTTVSLIALTYPVYFNETGLPSGRNWSVEIDQGMSSSVGPSILLWLANASDYAFSISGPSAFQPDPAHGSITVSGSSVIVRIQFAQRPPSLWSSVRLFGLSPAVSVTVIGILAAAAIGAGAWVYRGRSRRKGPDAPAT